MPRTNEQLEAENEALRAELERRREAQRTVLRGKPTREMSPDQLHPLIEQAKES